MLSPRVLLLLLRPHSILRYAFRQIKGRLIFRRWVIVHGDFKVKNRLNVRVGKDFHINEGVFILGELGVDIGDGVHLSAGAMIIDAGLDLNGFSVTARPSHFSAPVMIKSGAWIGAGAIVLPGITIGEKSVVGAGSIVTKNVPPFTIVAGNPARTLGRTDLNT